MATDAERELRLRLDRQAICANPFCGRQAPIAGEFCAACVAMQRKTREALRRSQDAGKGHA